MTPPLSIFIQNKYTVDTVVAALAAILGPNLSAINLDTGTIYECTILNIDWILINEHELENDIVDFTNYSHQIDLVPTKPHMFSPHYDQMYNSCATFVASSLASSLGCRTIVVAKLQRTVASFTP